MFTRKLLLILLVSFSVTVNAELLSPKLGKLASDGLVRQWNRDIFPDGEGLPEGHGNALQGKLVYEQYCQSCHGQEGTGGSADELAGARHGLTDNPPDKTIGTYWPYATTVFDFTRRAMPLNAPGSLCDSQIYAVTAYLLYINGIIKEKEDMNNVTLPRVKMPNRQGFVREKL